MSVGDARRLHSTCFSRDLRPVTTASVRRRRKIDAVDTLAVVAHNQHGCHALHRPFHEAPSASRKRRINPVKASLRNGNLPGLRFAAIVLAPQYFTGDHQRGCRGEHCSITRRPPSLFIVALLAILAAGSALYWYGVQGPRPARAARSPARPGVPWASPSSTDRTCRSIERAGLRAGVVHRGYSFPGRRQAAGGAFDAKASTSKRTVRRRSIRLFQAALDQAKAKKAQDQAQLTSAEKDLARSKTLVLSNITSQQIVDQQQGKVDQFKASMAADDAAIQTAETQLEYSTITAPSDGRIACVWSIPATSSMPTTRPRCDAGADATVRAVLFTLPARSLDDIRDAMARGPVEDGAYDQDNRRALATGKLLLVDNIIDPGHRHHQLKAIFANDD